MKGENMEAATWKDVRELILCVEDHIRNAKNVVDGDGTESDVLELHAELLRAQWRLGQAIDKSMYLEWG